MQEHFIKKYWGKLESKEDHAQKYKEEERKKQREEQEKRLEKLKNQKEKDKFYTVNRDNLRFKQIAQAQLLQRGDLEQFERIDREEIDKTQIKGIALASQSLENFEYFKEKGMYSSRNISVADSKDLNPQQQRFFKKQKEEFH